jgi:hypothetical protein
MSGKVDLIHHNIRNSFDSNEAVELAAAIYAAGK